MAGSRDESWWQPPKEFDAAADGDGYGDGYGATWDDVEEHHGTVQVDAGPADEGVARPPVELEDDEVALEDDGTSPPVGWTSPTGDVIPKQSSNRRFYVGIALIVVATVIGVLFALTLGSGDDGEGHDAIATTVPLDVRGETTVRPGGMSPACEAEQNRIQQAEQTYQHGSTAGQYTDMKGLVSSGKLAAPSTLFVITNEVPGNPSVVSFAGTSALEFEDYLVLPIPDGPCDTT